MNAERLLAHYDRIADAPDAVARLRRFILDLAVRGKLVPQDPKDEPASELLKRVGREKARLAGHGASSSSIHLLSPQDAPFYIPANWVWICLAELCAKTGSGSTPRGGQSAYASAGVPFLRSQNVYDDGLRLDDVVHIDQQTHARMHGTIVRPRDLLLNITGGSIGRCCLVPDTFTEGNVSQHVAIIRCALPGLERFLHTAVLSPYFQSLVVGEQTGAGRGGLPKNRMDRIPVPLPPIAEQQRIVVRIDELMALCDRLEAARAERETKRDRLTVASLARLNEPDPETFTDDARFALNVLPALTSRLDQIKQLRQTILNLAVHGKLVPQDAKDEPALKLLERIAKEKARMVKAGEIRKGQPLPAIAADDLPFELPRGWAWTRLGDVIHLVSGQHLQPPEYSEDPKAGLPYITGPSDFAADGLEISRFALVRKAVAKKGQLLLTVKGSGVGKTTICDIPEVAISRQLMALTAIGWNDRFLLLITHRLAEKLQVDARSLIPGISREDVNEFVVPLPPLAEQHRIVAKVDELMGVCDRLEASLAVGDDARSRLLDALLAEALEPAALELEAA